MKLSRGAHVVNALAWAGVAVLIGVAAVIADVLGFAGLLGLGLATSLICIRAELDQDTPSASLAVLRQRHGSPASPEARAARSHERAVTLAPFRFGRNCGIFIVVVGLIGFVWQTWWH